MEVEENLKYIEKTENVEKPFNFEEIYEKGKSTHIKLMNDWESSNPNWMTNEKLVEEYAEISKKVYEN